VTLGDAIKLFGLFVLGGIAGFIFGPLFLDHPADPARFYPIAVSMFFIPVAIFIFAQWKVRKKNRLVIFNTVAFLVGAILGFMAFLYLIILFVLMEG